jgi:hypothetical protein
MFKWSKALLGLSGVTPFPNSVSAIRFSMTSPTANGDLVAVLEKTTASSPLVLIFMSSSNGDIVRAIFETAPSESAKIYPNGLWYSNSNVFLTGEFNNYFVFM